jgi:hypothetical protein
VSGDVHTPTNAGPDPSSFGTPAGPAAVAPASDAKPELLVGGAFAGGLLTALILKRLVRD